MGILYHSYMPQSNLLQFSIYLSRLWERALQYKRSVVAWRSHCTRNHLCLQLLLWVGMRGDCRYFRCQRREHILWDDIQMLYSGQSIIDVFWLHIDLKMYQGWYHQNLDGCRPHSWIIKYVAFESTAALLVQDCWAEAMGSTPTLYNFYPTIELTNYFELAFK